MYMHGWGRAVLPSRSATDAGRGVAPSAAPTGPRSAVQRLCQIISASSQNTTTYFQRSLPNCQSVLGRMSLSTLDIGFYYPRSSRGLRNTATMDVVALVRLHRHSVMHLPIPVYVSTEMRCNTTAAGLTRPASSIVLVSSVIKCDLCYAYCETEAQHNVARMHSLRTACTCISFHHRVMSALVRLMPGPQRSCTAGFDYLVLLSSNMG